MTKIISRPTRLLPALFLFLLLRAPCAADAPSLDENLRVLLPLLGKTWKADFKDSTPEKPKADIMRWERALNGKAIRILHSINNGEYGGETLLLWDKAQKTIVYHYFTTAGFQTTGTMTHADGKFISHEIVTGNASGVTEVKAISQLLPDGSLHNKSMFLKKGEWVPGHEFHYRETPEAKVIFK